MQSTENKLLTNANAASVARGLWGSPARVRVMSRRGAYWADTPSHGGAIIDSRCLSEEEIENINKFVTHSRGRMFFDSQGKLHCFHHDLKIRPTYYKRDWNVVSFTYYVFEEDCDMAILFKFTNIRRKDESASEHKIQDYVEKTFQTYYSEEAKQRENKIRENMKNPDCVVSALRVTHDIIGNPVMGVTKVITADNRGFFVRGYDKISGDKFLKDFEKVSEESTGEFYPVDKHLLCPLLF